MTDIAEFLLARYAEDEAIARAAIADDGGSGEGFTDQYDCLVGTHDRPLDFVPRFGDDAAAMIVRFAVPDWILRDLAAKRAILALHKAVEGTAIFDDDEHNTLQCDECVGDGRFISWPCETMRLLAAPYVDHADYDPAWRVVTWPEERFTIGLQEKAGGPLIDPQDWDGTSAVKFTMPPRPASSFRAHPSPSEPLPDGRDL